MRITRNKYRVIYSLLVIVAFFLPAYNQLSALVFMQDAITAARVDQEVTLLDVAVILFPLLSIPATAFVVLFRAITKQYMNSLVLSMPFMSVVFFFFILVILTMQVNNSGLLGLFKELRVGFYIATLAAFLLMLTQSRKESLNFGTP